MRAVDTAAELAKQEVYEGDSRVWKENAEWGPGGGCCRKMVPIEAGDAQVAEVHTHAGTSSNTSTSTDSGSSGSSGNGSGGSGGSDGSGCCGSHA